MTDRREPRPPGTHKRPRRDAYIPPVDGGLARDYAGLSEGDERYTYNLGDGCRRVPPRGSTE